MNSNNESVENGEELQTFIKDPSKIDKKLDSSESKCTLKCACIAFGICVLIVAMIIGAGAIWYFSKINASGISSENSDEWKKKLTSSEKLENVNGANSPFAGKFKLVSYDDNYGDYLRGLGIPGFIVPIILGASETLVVETPKPEYYHNQAWKITGITDAGEKILEFMLNEQFKYEPKKGYGYEYNVPSMPREGVIFMNKYFPKKNRNSTEEMEFSASGIINTLRILYPVQIETRKYYERIIPGINDQPAVTEPSPFSDDEDDWGDDDSW